MRETTTSPSAPASTPRHEDVCEQGLPSHVDEPSRPVVGEFAESRPSPDTGYHGVHVGTTGQDPPESIGDDFDDTVRDGSASVSSLFGRDGGSFTTTIRFRSESGSRFVPGAR